MPSISPPLICNRGPALNFTPKLRNGLPPEPTCTNPLIQAQALHRSRLETIDDQERQGHLLNHRSLGIHYVCDRAALLDSIVHQGIPHENIANPAE